MEQTQTQLTEAQAIVVVEQGVRRETRKDSERTLDYCKDAVKLQGHNVRKLAQKAEARADLAREKAEAEGTEVPASFNADSYQSNVSNAAGVMALFEFDIVAFEEWLKQAESKSLSKIFKQFRELFTEPKAPKAKSPADEADGDGGESAEKTPLIDVVLSALPHLTVEERVQVIEACFAIDAPVSEEADEVVAA
jgi:hypothetical protein